MKKVRFGKWAGILMMLAGCPVAASAQKEVKTGVGFYPIPEIAFDADKGLQYGAYLEMFNFGDGSRYPNYYSKGCLEIARFTKGSRLFQIGYEAIDLLPGVRMSSSLFSTKDHAMDFFGFNGYQTRYAYELVEAGKNGGMLYSPNYKLSRENTLAKVDFLGNITDNLKWTLGAHYSHFSIDGIDYDNVNKGKDDAQKYTENYTLYQDFVDWGIISEKEADGGQVFSLRGGFRYDSRDRETAPTSGAWIDGFVELASSDDNSFFCRYSLIVRKYLRLLDSNRLSVAFRAAYQGSLGNDVPFYLLPYLTVVGEGADRDGMGGFRTVRGIMRDRVVGLDMASYNLELRSRVWQSTLFSQNVALGLSVFSDGAMVTRACDLSYRPVNAAGIASEARYRQTVGAVRGSDIPHVTLGGGLRVIVNDNFIVAAEYGTPLSHLVSSSNPIYNQDGTGSFYINTGYLF